MTALWALFRPTDPTFVADPYPTFDALRRAGPVLWHDELQMWLAFGHGDADAVLRARRLGRVFRRRLPEDEFATFNWLHEDSMLDCEPPKHTRLRRLMNRAFSRGHIERLHAPVHRVAEHLLDEVAGAGEMDLIADYAGRLPVEIIAELLGVPAADRSLLRPWSNAIVKMYEYERPPRLAAAAARACAEFAAYVRELAEQRRARPAGDLISELVAAQEAGERLSANELVANCVLLLNAGHEASVNVLGNGVHAPLRHPAELRRLRADPALVGPAIEEMIRYDGPLQIFERTAGTDVEIGGVTVRSGQKIAALLGAADRDPAVFAEPAMFRVDRAPNPHLGFGAGIHFCIGAPLARLELSIALPTLLRRMPRLELAASPEYRPNFVIRGLRELRVTC